MTIKNTHHGHAIKRLRHTLGLKQDVLASIMGLSQAQISTYEQRKAINNAMITRFAKALNVTPKFIEELEEDPVKSIIEAYIFEGENSTYEVFIKNNPINRIIELANEKISHYERMIELEKEKIVLLDKFLKEMSKSIPD